ncbi:MAG: hypothetical protein GWP10_05585 [Nitrospiraceae bacterium]|nr:hypothetical protein [Nitrospiraceae bacterium]
MMPSERLSKTIEKVEFLMVDTLEDKLKEYRQRQDEERRYIRESMAKYKQYLHTLDADTLSNIFDLCESGKSVFITHPVRIDNIYDMALTCRSYNMFYGPLYTPVTHPQFAIPKGEYRFMLIAIPVKDEDDDAPKRDA